MRMRTVLSKSIFCGLLVSIDIPSAGRLAEAIAASAKGTSYISLRRVAITSSKLLLKAWEITTSYIEHFESNITSDDVNYSESYRNGEGYSQ